MIALVLRSVFETCRIRTSSPLFILLLIWYLHSQFKLMMNLRETNNSSLPTCQELMQQPFNTFVDGSFLTHRTTPVTWKRRRDGSRQLTLPSTCHLKRYTAEEAGQCLKDKHLLFIGDSLTRYQYLSLAYFIEHKKWPPRFGVQIPCNHTNENGTPTCSKPEDPSVCVEGDWIEGLNRGWDPLWQAIGGGTDGGIFHGRMESRSVRLRPTWKSVENMKYVSSKESGRTTLSFVTELGWGKWIVPITGWNYTGCSYDASCRYSSEEYALNIKRIDSSDTDWTIPNLTVGMGPNGTLHNQYPNVTYTFYNRGLWGGLETERATSVMKSFSYFTGGHGQDGRCFFKTTNGSKMAVESNLSTWENDNVRQPTLNAGCEYFDAYHLTEEFSTVPDDEHKIVFWDAVHYQPWVYEELNQMLLNILCNTQ